MNASVCAFARTGVLSLEGALEDSKPASVKWGDSTDSSLS